jgi:hypothetical protein
VMKKKHFFQFRPQFLHPYLSFEQTYVWIVHVKLNLCIQVSPLYIDTWIKIRTENPCAFLSTSNIPINILFACIRLAASVILDTLNHTFNYPSGKIERDFRHYEDHCPRIYK